ncbi:MAG: energy-coupling factor ABC transporter permease [Deferrisomatales bacterium]|nr:energy-coupling factor ABC transporter permease [Deferrisomatales bacterium]
MHMADALLSPAVGGALWTAAAALGVYSTRILRADAEDRRVPLMGVVGAFVFAAQMINFTIPGTGSSGHLGGGLLLAILLGPHAAFLTLASVLTVQALFFADGGLLALGANVLNLGLFPCFVVYPLLYRPLAGTSPSPTRLTLAAVVAAVVGLQAGALGVVLETVTSGVSALPMGKFLALMLPIHLAIGLVEGLVTAAVVNFVRIADPGVLAGAGPGGTGGPLRQVLLGLGLAAAVTGGGLAWFSSANPDGLEWAVAGVTGQEGLEGQGGPVHAALERLQEKLSILPGYDFRSGDILPGEPPAGPWPAPDTGTSVSGLVGGTLTLAIASLVGVLLRRRSRAADS